VKTNLRRALVLVFLAIIGAVVWRERRIDTVAGATAAAADSRSARVSSASRDASRHQTTGAGAPDAPAITADVSAPPATDAARPAARAPDASMEPVGYAGPERWRRTPVPCWGIRGTAPEDFHVIADRDEHTTGKSSIGLESVRHTDGWGTLYQFASADALRGKRIEFMADIRTSSVENGASLLVRVDDADGRAIAIDNMFYSYGPDHSESNLGNRSLSGDNDWTSASVVLDVPADAHALSYGVALTGSGKVWLDNAHLEVVSRDTPVTALARGRADLEYMTAFRMSAVPPVPENLDFEVDARDCQ
jgi:hypothetical protein